MPAQKLVACIVFYFCIALSFSQSKTTTPANNKSITGKGEIRFTSDGASYALGTEKDEKINLVAELRHTAGVAKMLIMSFNKPASRDTILLYLYDKNGIPASANAQFSRDAKLLFIYKLYGKGSMLKSVDNAKNEIDNNNYVRLTRLELRQGGMAEGVFHFTDILFQNNAGKTEARVKGINDGMFKTIVTQYNEIESNMQKTGSAGLIPVASLLFKDVKCKLTDAEKNQIVSMTGFVLSGKKDEPFAMDKESLDYPHTAAVTITDMNKDGVEEVFIQFGNTYTSGAAGQSIVLYIKDKVKGYQPNLGFPGVEPEQLKTGFGGYPDLLIGGPGFEFPVWRWNGKEYVFFKTQKM